LARLLAERIVGHAFEASDDAIAHFALTLPIETGGAQEHVLCVSPTHAERLRSFLARHDFGERELSVRDDVHLAPGEIRIELPNGHVQSSVASSLETLARVALTRVAR
jgi:flagellar biosynthesis/type III secretory pathway protein FliH